MVFEEAGYVLVILIRFFAAACADETLPDLGLLVLDLLGLHVIVMHLRHNTIDQGLALVHFLIRKKEVGVGVEHCRAVQL